MASYVLRGRPESFECFVEKYANTNFKNYIFDVTKQTGTCVVTHEGNDLGIFSWRLSADEDQTIITFDTRASDNYRALLLTLYVIAQILQLRACSRAGSALGDSDWAISFLVAIIAVILFYQLWVKVAIATRDIANKFWIAVQQEFHVIESAKAKYNMFDDNVDTWLSSLLLVPVLGTILQARIPYLTMLGIGGALFLLFGLTPWSRAVTRPNIEHHPYVTWKRGMAELLVRAAFVQAPLIGLFVVQNSFWMYASKFETREVRADLAAPPSPTTLMLIAGATFLFWRFLKLSLVEWQKSSPGFNRPYPSFPSLAPVPKEMADAVRKHVVAAFIPTTIVWWIGVFLTVETILVVVEAQTFLASSRNLSHPRDVVQKLFLLVPCLPTLYVAYRRLRDWVGQRLKRAPVVAGPKWLEEFIIQTSYQLKVRSPIIHVQSTVSVFIYAVPKRLGRHAIVLSSGLLEMLDINEVKAAVAHEFGHLLGAGRFISLRLLSNLSFFSAGFLTLCVDMSREEMDADRLAVGLTGNVSALRTAIIKVAVSQGEIVNRGKLSAQRTYDILFGPDILGHTYAYLPERLKNFERIGSGVSR